MPNRIIKESICTSETMSKLSWFEQVLFIRLVVLVDDYGRYDARPKIIKGKGFPLDNVTDKQISIALSNLATADIVDLYIVDGKPYLQLKTWAKHQQIRACKSKFPEPNESDRTCNQLISDDCKCSRNPIQSESKSESKTKETRARREYGEFKNVLLSDEQYEKLVKEFPHDYEQRIEQISAYCASTGKSYKDYFATIRNWARRDREKADETSKNSSFDQDEFFETALKRSEALLGGKA